MSRSSEGTLPDKAESTDRIEALSDGIFAVALTLLVLDIRVPNVVEPWHKLGPAMFGLMPRIGTYVASFLIVGYTWIWHHLTFAMIDRGTRVLMWINLILLLAVGFLPFSTALIAKYPGVSVAVATYGANLLWFSVMLNVLLAYADRAHLISGRLDAPTIQASKRRGYLQTILTAAAIGAGLIFPYVGIASFILIAILYIATGSRNTIVDPKPRRT